MKLKIIVSACLIIICSIFTPILGQSLDKLAQEIESHNQTKTQLLDKIKSIDNAIDSLQKEINIIRISKRPGDSVYVYTWANANIYEEPSLGSRTIGDLPTNNFALVLEESEKYVQIFFEGIIGYISKSMLKANEYSSVNNDLFYLPIDMKKIQDKESKSNSIYNNSSKSNSYSAPKTSKTQKVYSGRCQATTKKGTQCKRSAKAGSSYCWQHGG